ncbi:MAG: hypothetical protein K0B15_15300, partial [Lentimicrobium sp.]|nr:hypothetical protein [Lentimicrobium sp.]
MKNFIRIIICFVFLGPITLSTLSSTNSIPEPVPAPSGTQINLTNTTALDWSDCEEYPDHEMKVTFFGARYSDGQDVWD